MRDEQRNLHGESEERQLSKQEERRKPSPLSEDDNVLNRREDDFVLPVMASTLVCRMKVVSKIQLLPKSVNTGEKILYYIQHFTVSSMEFFSFNSRSLFALDSFVTSYNNWYMKKIRRPNVFGTRILSQI